MREMWKRLALFFLTCVSVEARKCKYSDPAFTDPRVPDEDTAFKFRELLNFKGLNVYSPMEYRAKQTNTGVAYIVKVSLINQLVSGSIS